MKKSIALLSWFAAFVLPLLGSESSKELLVNAAKALAQQSGYQWQTTVEMPEESRFRQGPTTGQIEKDGWMAVSLSFGRSDTKAYVFKEEMIIQNREGEWQTAKEMEGGPGFGRFFIQLIQSVQTPVDEVLKVLEGLNEIRLVGDRYIGDFTEEEAGKLANNDSGGGRRRGGGRPELIFAKAQARFSIENGVLSKYELMVDSSSDLNGSEILVQRTTTTVIDKVGEVKIELPDAVLAKMIPPTGDNQVVIPTNDSTNNTR